MKKWILHLDMKEQFHAGSKAMSDCEKVLERKGYQRLHLRRREQEGMLGKIKNLWGYQQFFTLSEKDILVIQHPLYIGTRYMKSIQRAKRRKKFQVMVIIHDLESLRGLFPQNKELFEELDERMLNVGDVLIVHNEKMMNYLNEYRGISKKKMINLQIFDYLTTANPRFYKSKDKRVCIAVAGNFALEKAGYIYEMIELPGDFSFHIYGVNFQKELCKGNRIRYCGAYQAEELPGVMEGDYGLVWDGETIDTCKGSTGEYMKYNNPHKVSSYIAAGIPIIIWKQSALAEFVREQQIGVIVDNLSDLENSLAKVSEAEYMNMKKNVEKLSGQVRSGAFISKACIQAEEKLKGERNV